MAGFFDRLLKKKESPKELKLHLSEIAGYLDNKDDEVSAAIDTAAKNALSIAHAEIDVIAAKVHRLEEAGEDDVKHPSPKVKHTALKSKKNFIISMEKTLSTELPEDPEKLYSALVELIRALANNMRRQGKYLHPAFPDDMKDIKSSLDVIGRALNAMTGDVKPSVELREKVAVSRKSLDEIFSAAAEYNEAQVESESLKIKVESLDESHVRLESGREEFMTSGDFQAYESLSSKLKSLGEEKGEVSARYGSLLVTCDNVLRKTAYIAEKNGDNEISEKMNILVVHLHSGEREDYVEARRIYGELYSYIHETISENETLIKNKHEEQLFSSPKSFILNLDDICGEYSRVLSEMSLV